MAERVSVKIENRQLSLSNLDKVLYPETGFTKGEVIDYYTRIAPVLLPHLADRPLTVKRYPNGVDEPFFFEKNAARGTPDWVRTESPAGAGFDHEPRAHRLRRRRGAGHAGVAGQPGRARTARAAVAVPKRGKGRAPTSSCSTSTRDRRPTSPSAARSPCCCATCSPPTA